MPRHPDPQPFTDDIDWCEFVEWLRHWREDRHLPEHGPDEEHDGSVD